MYTEIVSGVFELSRMVTSTPMVIEGMALSAIHLLCEAALSREQTDVSTPSLNIGAWKSREDIFEFEPFTLVYDALREMLGERELAGWVMVNRAGSEHPRHRHANARLCGVLYLAVGDPVTPTVFETVDGELAIDPVPGRLVLFSPMMWHHVPRYVGFMPRISLAFDVR